MEATKVWTVDEVKYLLEHNVKAVHNGVVALYKLQTTSEQHRGHTEEYNGVGFNGLDAPILTSFAEQITNGRTLSPKQFALAQKKIKKYAKQLTKVANGEIKLER